jgi:hypothetical protein
MMTMLLLVLLDARSAIYIHTSSSSYFDIYIFSSSTPELHFPSSFNKKEKKENRGETLKK